MGTVLWPLAMLLPRVLSSPSPPCTTDSLAMTLSDDPKSFSSSFTTIPLGQIACTVLAGCMSFPTSDSKYCRTPSCDWSEWVDNPDLTNDTLVTQDTLGRDSCNQTLDLDAPCTDIILEPSLCPYLFNGRFDDYEFE